MAHLLIPRRFNGPTGSGNGGWSSGALADLVPGHSLERAVSVRLLLPPPLDVPLQVERDGDATTVTDQARPVATARPAAEEPVLVPPVPVLEAADAESRYAGLRSHPFPTCFTCGPQRRPGDGLRIFAGPVTGRPDTVAATWTPYEISVPITWAALDCPSGWASDIEDRPMVLGTMTTRIHRLPSTRERYVVVGELRAVEGRKTRTASSLYGPGDVLVATAEQTWIVVDPKDFP